MPDILAQFAIPRIWTAGNTVISTVKDPLADENFTIDWSGALATILPSGDTIKTSTWDVPPALAASRQAVINGATGTVCGLAGGTLGTAYFVTNTVLLLTSGQTLVQNIEVTIQSV